MGPEGSLIREVDQKNKGGFGRTLGGVPIRLTQPVFHPCTDSLDLSLPNPS